MNIDFDHKKVNVPLCTCGKCIIRRQRNPRQNLYCYKNLTSTYLNDYVRTSTGEAPKYLNRSKRNCFDRSYKEHLPAELMSTMKFDYKPFKIKLDSNKDDFKKIENLPFYGRTSYNFFFPNYGSASNGNQPKQKVPRIIVPFKGNSNYLENYKKLRTHVKNMIF